MRTKKIAILMILVTVAVMVAPASAYFSAQNVETKAERMVNIAENASDAVLDLIQTTEANDTIMELIVAAELDDDFYGNVFLCVEEGTIVNSVAATENGKGWEALNSAQERLLVAVETEDFEEVIDNAREALEIFRDVLRAINGILLDVGVEPCPACDAETFQEAIERSLAKVAELQALLADEEMLQKLADAEDLLNAATDMLPDEIEGARDNLQDANALISEVCRDLRGIAQDLNWGRIRSYIEKAYQHRERVRERIRTVWNNVADIDEFLQRLGYQNEEEFMAQFQEMIQNAQDAKNVKDAIETLKEIGQVIRNMDNSLIEHPGFNGKQTMPGNGSGFGNMGGGNSR
ncbi:MAG: hypothetical protein QCH99_06785 [Candidatus Bathyarchaeota archaeon]|nr:hypothetical protein [Candidatus Bathyarchaeum tardum]WGM90463.1 MAG: hypothetical protein NUK63_04895 [Candidatus Bathyarchaeum tardum]